jgi:hypothetical protein
MHQNFFNRIQVLGSFSPEEGQLVPEFLVKKHFKKNALILEEGEVSEPFYLVEQRSLRLFLGLDGFSELTDNLLL